jgi:hypothetical protein
MFEPNEGEGMIQTNEKMKDGSFYYWHECNRCKTVYGYKHRKGKTIGYCKDCLTVLRSEASAKAAKKNRNLKMNDYLQTFDLAKGILTKEGVKSFCTYHQEGVLTYNADFGPKMKKGCILGTLNNGFRTVSINKISYPVSLLIWVYHNDSYTGTIYHIDRDPSNSRIENLQTEPSILDTEDFITRARQAHGDTYDYSKSVYYGHKVPITITCSVHGDFQQRPHVHTVSKCGCPGCGVGGFDSNKPGILYYLRLQGGLFKVGITNYDVKTRYAYEGNHLILEEQTWYYENGFDCYKKEQELLQQYKEYRYTGEAVFKYTGTKELFIKDVLNLFNDDKS